MKQSKEATIAIFQELLPAIRFNLALSKEKRARISTAIRARGVETG
jgi:hypothetical protein